MSDLLNRARHSLTLLDNILGENFFSLITELAFKRVDAGKLKHTVAT